MKWRRDQSPTETSLKASPAAIEIAAIIGCCLLPFVTGCSDIPTAGPTKSDVIEQASKPGPLNFALVEVDPHVIAVLAAEPEDDALSRLEGSSEPPRPVIGIGDAVSITIWDSPNGSILGPPSQDANPGTGGAANGVRTITIPDQIVAPDGGISVPYIGRVKVASRTPLEVQQTVQRLLGKSGFEPQVLVTITKGVSQNVTVSGETITGMQVPLAPGGERLLDVIAAAGGAKSAPYESAVRLSRHGVVVTIPMDRLISDPHANLYAVPGDTITLLKVPRTFTVFGATLNNLQIPFGAEEVNLAQAVAKAGGLQDTRADPEGVFLLRLEPPQVIASLGAAVPVYPEVGGRLLPVVYHLNLREMSGYFLAEKLPLRDEDIIYVANAPINDLQKLATLIGTIMSPAINGVVVTQSLKK